MENTELTLKEIESLKQEYEDLYRFWIDNGIMEYKAMEMLEALPQHEAVYMNNSARFKCQMSVPLDFLEENTDWVNMDNQQKGYLLWGLGMDTHKDSFYTETRRVREGTKIVFKTVVYGTERLDDDWLKQGKLVDRGLNFVSYSSEGARGLAWGYRH